ncbi:hypothetical protein K435DRAFT_812439 [Dendrothele bispora CBS 962.96]|uniref:Uncharacterized protein n=1 Tax=Dendrothele bispora (strain CBS 962.96) TaxID=1314807 RepID=A0A4S8KP68_DENBC|nr:hypothetical protein K435DRAFT_812439 [Dendrothele bispora CBS 962.96]
MVQSYRRPVSFDQMDWSRVKLYDAPAPSVPGPQRTPRNQHRHSTPPYPRTQSRSPAPPSLKRDMASNGGRIDSSSEDEPSAIPPRHRHVRFADSQSSQAETHGVQGDGLHAATSAPNKNRTASKKIAKPLGEAGRPRRGGYSLRTALGWDVGKYTEVKSFISKLCRDHLDGHLPFTEQAINPVQRVRDQARTKFPFLDNYADGWATDDFIRSHLKYRKKTLTIMDLKAEAQAKKNLEVEVQRLKTHLLSVPETGAEREGGSSTTRARS